MIRYLKIGNPEPATEARWVVAKGEVRLPVEEYNRLVQTERAAERALSFLTDWHCDNQRDVIEALREALRD